MSTVIDLSALGTQGFVIQGAAARDYTGFSVASAGDINGDGFVDLIVGAPGADAGGDHAGAAYVLFGKAGGFTNVNLAALAPADGFVIQGFTSYDGVGVYAGASVASAGDINGDGFDDLAIGVGYSDYRGPGAPRYYQAGETYVIFGKAGGFGTLRLGAIPPSVGFVVQGDTSGDLAGSSASSAGDVNGDGFADLIVGAPGNDAGGTDAGAAYVIFGKAGGFGRIDVGALAPGDGFVIQGDIAGDQAGISVSAAGDVNGDGFGDLIVGANYGDDGGDRAGEAYVIFGKAAGFGTIDLTTLVPADGFTIQGDMADDRAGRSVSAAGDVNGDGFADIIVGAPFGDDGGNFAGEAYVIFGKAAGFGRIDLTALAPADGFVIQGGMTFDQAGGSVSAAGDVNGDGFADVIVSAGGVDAGGNNAGAAYVIFGKAGGFGRVNLNALPSTDGFVIQGGVPGGYVGDSVSAAGDVNGDGFADLIVGAGGVDDGGTDAGAAYVIFGQAPTTSVTRTGTAIANVIRGGVGDDALSGLDGDDTLIAADGDDRESGGAGKDLLQGQNGDDSLSGGSGNDVLQGGAGSDRLDGGSGLDRLDGGAGGDILTGGSGNDVYFVDSVADQVREQGDGDRDRVESSISYSLAGSLVEDLTLTGKGKIDGTGSDAANVLTGNAAANALSGGGGGDTLIGGRGLDTLTGGKGADVFRFDEGDTAADAATADRITDFLQKDRDLIDLSAIDAKAATPGNDAFTFIGAAAFSGVAGQLRYQVSGADTLVSGDTNGDRAADFTIRLTGVFTLTAADFLFAAPAAPLGGAHLFLAHTDITLGAMVQLA